MKCIGKQLLFLIVMIISIKLLVSCDFVDETIFNRTNPYELVMNFESEHFNSSLYLGAPFTNTVAVTSSSVSMEGFELYGDVYAAALFSISNPRVLYGVNLFDRLYPASTTKVMTALVAIKYGNMDDMVTVSANAVNFGWYAQMGGLRAGDQVSMADLIGGLMLHSGNDNAVAIAEHISGTEEEFVRLMNREAYHLGATHTNFANSHGLHDDNQYTTLYDLYLIFNSLARDQRFIDIIHQPYVVGRITDSYGGVRYIQWFPTNWYNDGSIPHPDGVTVLGGKTGTTDQAGACLILFSVNANHDFYISIIMGASTRNILYYNMTNMLRQGLFVNEE